MTDKYTRAQALYGQRQYVEAAELFRAAAEEGDARAMSMLGVMYYSGKGVKKDADEAIRLYKLSAEKGDVNGMLRLASAYQLGWDVEESYETALCWFERAAECGSAKGAYRAGQFHAQGLGTELSLSKALEWWKRSLSIEPSGEVAYRIASVYYNGKGIARDLFQARYYFSYANKHGYECEYEIALVEKALDKAEGK